MTEEFCYNIAYTVAANEGAMPEERLTHAELWQVVKRGGPHPDDFAPYVRSCKVVSGDRFRFVRELVIGDGAVHTNDGTTIVQEVSIQDDLYVAATTHDNGAKTTALVTYGSQTEAAQEEHNPYFTLFYELKLGDKSPAPGSKEADDIKTNYRALAKNMCNDTIRLARKWKLDGTLARWAKEEKKGIW